MNTIIWSKIALKQARRFPQEDRETLFNKADTLKAFPECRNIKKLTRHKYQYRLRVGRYRLFFDFDGVIKIISIEEVKIRDENTY